MFIRRTLLVCSQKAFAPRKPDGLFVQEIAMPLDSLQCLRGDKSVAYSGSRHIGPGIPQLIMRLVGGMFKDSTRRENTSESQNFPIPRVDL
mmetsp:Transcript_53142/g.113493  ORF Transcript_53142/g.113493 Transcript_53142/m.113493 type:complete len:91 (-) Transcript_53142:58-330(-)